MSNKGYNQKEKNMARNLLVKNSIEKLTTQRKQSMLVNEEKIIFMIEHFVNLINSYLKSVQRKLLSEEFKQTLVDDWICIYNSKYIEKRVDQLKVLYLAGPQPTNDLNVLLNNGIKAFNIWAVESDNDMYKQGINDLRVNNHYIKLHRGSLKAFFESCTEQFDIVYFDACTPIFSNKYNPINVLEELFANRRLAELSVLITNFSEPDINSYNDWSKLLACWYGVRYEQCPRSTHFGGFSDIHLRVDNIEGYSKFISERIPEYYSDFIQKFISTFASEIVPFIKITTFPTIDSKLFKKNNYTELLNKRIDVKEIEYAEDLLSLIPHYMLSLDVV